MLQMKTEVRKEESFVVKKIPSLEFILYLYLNVFNNKSCEPGWAWWLMSVIPALWETEADGSLKPGVREQHGQHGETPSLLKIQKIS